MTIRGVAFAAGATVTIGGRPATDVSVQRPEVITAKSPAAPGAGAADVVVTVSRNGTLPGGFTYHVPAPNNAPVIMSIVAQGSRPGQPANFADVGESIGVTTTVYDDETPAEQLEYHWSATLGTFSGSGASVTWHAPANADTPVQATIILRVVERYGAGGMFQQDVTGTRTLAVHDSARELGDMARRFLTEFSKPQTNQDWRDIMRDFERSVCPVPGEVDEERDQVEAHYTNFFMHHYDIGPASVSVHFGGRCFAGLPGDACVAVPVSWDSTDKRTHQRGAHSGVDHLTGVYSPTDARWWLCSSRYQVTATSGATFFYAR